MADDTGLYDLKKDLTMSMIIAAFTGVSWFIGAEINTSLFLLFKRRRGLYFWSAALASWGVILQPLFIILMDFGIWTNLTGSVIMIYLTWAIMVVPQSWLLYSRLHLITNHASMLRWIKIVLIFTSIVFSVPTIIIGTIAQATNLSPGLFNINLIWDRVQLAVYFAQETALSLLYIWQAHKFWRNTSLLDRPQEPRRHAGTKGATPARTGSEARQVLLHLVLANILVIALDIALLGVQCADLFYLQGAFKPCVYGVKLKVEFAILNRLVEAVRMRGQRAAGSYYPDASGSRGGAGLFGAAGGRPSTKAAEQPQPEIHVSGFGEPKWEYDTQNESSRQEQIGLGTLDHRPVTVSRAQSHESEHPIWDGQGPDRGVIVQASSLATATEYQPQWQQVYHQ